MGIGRGSKETDFLYRFISKFGVKEIDDLMVHLPRSLVDSRSNPVPTVATSQIAETSEADFINQLPDEILISIISLLSMKEAISTSVLSRRWRYLWKELPFNLDFDVISMMGNDYQICQDGQQASEFSTLICQILESLCDAEIGSFRIKYPFTTCHTGHIRRWVQFAFEKKVQDLVLDFSHTDMTFRPCISPAVEFCREGQGSPFLKHLSLSTCYIPQRPDFTDFCSLTSLFLENVYLNKKKVNSILSTCLSLQWLSIKRCCGRRCFNVVLSGHFRKLKHVNISKCHKLKKIKIIGIPNIVSLECRPKPLIKGSSVRKLLHLRRLCFVEVEDSLAGVSYACSRLASDLPQLETLMLSLQTIKKDMIPWQVPAFTKLKQLVLLDHGSSNRSLFYLTTFLMKASPCLQKLELHLPRLHFPPIDDEEAMQIDDEEAMQIDNAITYEEWYHHNLKYLEIYGFQGFEAEIHLAKFLLNCAVVLESMKIDRQVLDYDGNGEWIVRAAHNHIRPRKIRRLLFRDVPPTTKLIIL